MLPTTHWPEVEEFRDHSKWRPDWTADRPRLLWYLTFEDQPQVRDAAAATSTALEECNADVVPPEWLHMTLSDIGFAEDVDDRMVRAAGRRALRMVRGVVAPKFVLGPLGVLPGAVVLVAEPVRPLLELRERVRRATAQAGIPLPEDLDGPFEPHVSLCYMKGHSDHDRLRYIVEASEPRTVTVRCDRLSQVLVHRTNGHYQWQVLAEVPLGGAHS